MALTSLVWFIDSDPLGKEDKPNKDDSHGIENQWSIFLLHQTISYMKP